MLVVNGSQSHHGKDPAAFRNGELLATGAMQAEIRVARQGGCWVGTAPRRPLGSPMAVVIVHLLRDSGETGLGGVAVG